MRLTRRNLLRSMAMAGAAAALPAVARAQDGDSIFDMLDRNRVLRETDPTANTQSAQALIDTIEPILSIDTAYNLQLAIAQYEPFVAAGGWHDVPQEVYGLLLGHNKKSVQMLRQRLMSSGDLPPSNEFPKMFDDEVDRALRTFQARHGLIVNGQVDEPTYYALAVPADVRLNQLYLNAAARQQHRRQAQRPLSRRQHPGRHASRPSRPRRSCSATPRWSARSIAPTPILEFQGPSGQVQPLLDGAQEHHREGPDPVHERGSGIPDQVPHPHLRRQRQRGVARPRSTGSTDEAVQYTFRQDPGGRELDGPLQDRLPQPVRRLPARHAAEGAVRRERALPLVGLRARARASIRSSTWLLRDNGGWDLPTVQAAFASNERLDVPLQGPGADPHHLHHRLGQPAGHRELPRRRLPVRRGRARSPSTPDADGERPQRQGSGRFSSSSPSSAQQMRVAAIDAATGIEVVVIAPLSATPLADADPRARQAQAAAGGTRRST